MKFHIVLLLNAIVWASSFVCVCMWQASEENGEQMACYFVAVSLSEDDDCKNNRWTVTRKLSEFQALHRKLTEVRLIFLPPHLSCVISHAGTPFKRPLICGGPRRVAVATQ